MRNVLRYMLFGTVALVTLGVLIVSWLSFSGRRDWATTKAELLARGEKLSLVELLPPPPPDEDNFFADPIWLEVFEAERAARKVGAAPQPKMAKEQRQLAALEAPLPEAMEKQARTLLPQRAPSQAAPLTAGQVGRFAQMDLEAAKDPATREALAQLILDAHAVSAPLRARLDVLAQRREARVPFDMGNGFAGLHVEHLHYLLSLAQIEGQIARAHLALGDSAAAIADVSRILRLAQLQENAPFLITSLIRLSTVSIAASTIDQGIVEHRWTDEELAFFEESLRAIDVRRSHAQALRTERGATNEAIQSADTRGGSEAEDWNVVLENSQTPGWVKSLANHAIAFCTLYDQGPYNRLIQSYIDSLESPQGTAPSALPALPAPGWASMLSFLSRSAGPAIENTVSQAVYIQSLVTQTRLACALERYRLSHGRYPDSLGALVPEFFEAIPADTIAGQIFHYRVEGDGFQLWSAGWNEKDEGGVPGQGKGREKGDWVWNRPPGSRHQQPISPATEPSNQ